MAVLVVGSRVEHLSEDVTLYLGDCREILPTIGKVDAVVTDPPYGILDLKGAGSTTAIRKSPRQPGKLKSRIITHGDTSWDQAPEPALFDLLRDISTRQIIWGGNYFSLPPTRAVLAWDKQQPWANFSQFELAWTNLGRPAALYRASATRSTPNKVHPTQKPVGLMAWCIGFLKPGVTVCDPFMGSGTTGVACVQMGQPFIGIEINQQFFDAACLRITDELQRPKLDLTSSKSLRQEPML